MGKKETVKAPEVKAPLDGMFDKAEDIVNRTIEKVEEPVIEEPVPAVINFAITPETSKLFVNEIMLDAPKFETFIGENLSIKVTDAHYVTKTLEHTVTKPEMEISIALEFEQHKIVVDVNHPAFKDATIQINKQKVNELMVPFGSKVTIDIEKKGYMSIGKTFVCDDDFTLSEPEGGEWKKPTVCFDIQSNFGDKIQGIKIITDELENPKIFLPGVDTEIGFGETLSVNISAFGCKAIKKSFIIDEMKNPIVVVLESEETKNENTETNSLEELLETVTPIIKRCGNYSYLNCGRFIKNEGITEESLSKFYKEFGSSVMSQQDYVVWNALQKYFGPIQEK